ncbi:MAG: FHA domain-containing protein [Hyphomicrobiaceae bacterium]
MDVFNVWLEDGKGHRWPVHATCSIGRSASNDVVIDDGRVSRRHALVHRQGDADYWIIDLGSGNGTYLNGRRVTMPVRLGNGDDVVFGDHAVVFRQRAGDARPEECTLASEETIISIKDADCWLLVADIKGSSALAARMPPAEYAMLIGRWMGECKEIVDVSGGVINKFLGDGFLAYWRDSGGGDVRLVEALQQLRTLQRGGQGPAFRMAVHHGSVAFGGHASLGEDSLSGLDLALAFRMEKIAGRLGVDVLASEAVKVRLDSRLAFGDLGLHHVLGVGADLRFYALA